MPASQAAPNALRYAFKHGLRDDVTVLVIDFLPSEAERHPPAGRPAAGVEVRAFSRGMLSA